MSACRLVVVVLSRDVVVVAWRRGRLHGCRLVVACRSCRGGAAPAIGVGILSVPLPSVVQVVGVAVAGSLMSIHVDVVILIDVGSVSVVDRPANLVSVVMVGSVMVVEASGSNLSCMSWWWSSPFEYHPFRGA